MASPSDFVNSIYQEALNLGVPEPAARVAATQAALESNYGKSAPGNNYFGIKGKGQTLSTKEAVGGALTKQTSSFRTYDSPTDSVKDWVAQMERNWPGVLAAPTYTEAINALDNGRLGAYATDKNEVNDPLSYQDKLSQINQSYLGNIPAGGTSDSIGDGPGGFASLGHLNTPTGLAGITPTPGGQVKLASGKMIAPGVYPASDGAHSIQVADDGSGNARITKILGPGEIPGIINPLSEVNSNTVAGSAIRSALPQAIAGGLSSLSYVPEAVNNAKDQAVSALQNFGSSAMSGLKGLFGGAPAAPTYQAPTTTYTTKQMQVSNPAYLKYISAQNADPIGSGIGSFSDLQALSAPPPVAPPQYITQSVRVPVQGLKAIAPAPVPQPVINPANQSPGGLAALMNGQSAYTVQKPNNSVLGAGALMPTKTISGGVRNTYGD